MSFGRSYLPVAVASGRASAVGAISENRPIARKLAKVGTGQGHLCDLPRPGGFRRGSRDERFRIMTLAVN
jgi:hypothetical protein